MRQWLMFLIMAMLSMGVMAQGTPIKTEIKLDAIDRELQINPDVVPRVNLRICKRVAVEIDLISREIARLEKELNNLVNGPVRPHKDLVESIKKKIRELTIRRSKLQDFYKRNCSKEVVDCDQLKIEIAKLQSLIAQKKQELAQLEKDLKAALEANHPKKVDAIKKRIVAIALEVRQLIERLNKLQESYKKHCG